MKMNIDNIITNNNILYIDEFINYINKKYNELNANLFYFLINKK